MTTIDEIGRSAAGRLRSDMAGRVDVADGPARARAAAPSPTAPRRLSPRAWGIAASIAVVSIGAVGIVVVSQRDDTSISPTQTTQLPTPSTVPTTTVPASTTTTTPPPTPGAPIAVSYLDPPPVFDPQVFAIVPLAAVPDGPDGPVAAVAVAPDGAVVVDGASGAITVVSASGVTRTLPGPAGQPAFDVVVGPDGLLYGLRSTESVATIMEGVAIRLNSTPGGQVASTFPVDANGLVELPPGSLGVGRDGIVLRTRRPGEVVLPYVAGTSGTPTADAPFATITDDGLVTTDQGGAWQLSITSDPAGGESFVGASPPAATADGGAVVWTAIGAALNPGGDYSENAMPVVADLRADGTGTWWRLPDGWTVASSDLWGTILSRTTAGGLELARFPNDSVPVVVDAGSLEVLDVDLADAVGTPLDVPACSPVCPSIGFTADVRLVTYDDGSRTFTVEQPNGAAPRTIAMPSSVASPAYLVTVGPDDVLYVEASLPSDATGEVVALALRSDGTARVVARSDGTVDQSGDSTRVPTRDGLVSVGCCGGADAPRPNPSDEPVMAWVEANGTRVTDDRPHVVLEPNAGRFDVVRTDASGATQRWATSDGDFGLEMVRDMPVHGVLSDGSVVLAWYDMADGSNRVLKLLPDGAVERIALPASTGVTTFDTVRNAAIVFSDGQYERIALPTHASATDGMADAVQIVGPTTAPSADEVLARFVTALSSPDGCERAPQAGVSQRSGTDPVEAVVSYRVGCDDSGAGGMFRLTIGSDTAGSWTVQQATLRRLCTRATSGDLCV